jgi:hypothetical protein
MIKLLSISLHFAVKFNLRRYTAGMEAGGVDGILMDLGRVVYVDSIKTRLKAPTVSAIETGIS